MAIVSTELEVQDITTLPKRTASGIDPDTDFVLGVEENGIAYKADIEDLGQSIVQGAKSNLLGRNQTVASAFRMLREETNEKIKESYGAPLVATTILEMTDKKRVYVYTGDESGMLTNRWYYWNGSEWQVGGLYFSGVIATDDSLSMHNTPADSKAVGDALEEVNTELSSIADDIEQLQEDSSSYAVSTSIAPEYSPSGIYAVGDHCMHDGALYRCATAISTAEAWNASHWTADNVKNIADGLKGDVSDLKDDLNMTRLLGILSKDIVVEKGTATLEPDYINNTVIAATGKVGGASSKRITNSSLIYIPENATLNFSVDTTVYYSPTRYCFDKNGVFIEERGSSAVGLAVGTYYVRILLVRRDNGDISITDAKNDLVITLTKTTPYDVVAEQKVFTKKMIYGGTLYTDGKKINASRQIVDADGYCVTDFFDVTGGTAITIYCNASSSDTLYGLEYDKDKNIIDRWGITAESRTFNLTANARYFRFTFTSGYSAKALQSNEDIYVATFNGIANDVIAAVPDIVDDTLFTIGTNKYNPDTKVNGYINNNTGNVTSNDDYFTSDFIDVSAFRHGYAFTPKARKLIFFDATKTAIAASYQSEETAAGVIALNPAYKYARFSWFRTSTNVMVCDAETLPSYEPYEIVAKDEVNYLNNDTKAKVQQMVGEGGKSSQIASYLNGKTVLVFGDSIMHGAGNNDNGIADLLSDKYGMIAADYSVSGATMGIRTDDPSYTVDEVHHIAKQVRNAISANITPDIIVFNGGTNDIGGSIPIGNITQVYTEPVSESYFADGFETVAYLLKKNFVGIPMIYMRAHNMSSRTYDGQVQYGELGNQIAEKWGIRNVDMYIRMNTQLAEYRTAYLVDYTHPNEAGYNKYYVPALEDFIFRELV